MSEPEDEEEEAEATLQVRPLGGVCAGEDAGNNEEVSRTLLGLVLMEL